MRRKTQDIRPQDTTVFDPYGSERSGTLLLHTMQTMAYLILSQIYQYLTKHTYFIHSCHYMFLTWHIAQNVYYSVNSQSQICHEGSQCQSIRSLVAGVSL